MFGLLLVGGGGGGGGGQFIFKLDVHELTLLIIPQQVMESSRREKAL